MLKGLCSVYYPDLKLRILGGLPHPQSLQKRKGTGFCSLCLRLNPSVMWERSSVSGQGNYGAQASHSFRQAPPGKCTVLLRGPEQAQDEGNKCFHGQKPQLQKTSSSGDGGHPVSLIHECFRMSAIYLLSSITPGVKGLNIQPSRKPGRPQKRILHHTGI